MPLRFSYFGADLSDVECKIEPWVETKTKNTGRPWIADGLTRTSANKWIMVDGTSSIGSAPMINPFWKQGLISKCENYR